MRKVREFTTPTDKTTGAQLVRQIGELEDNVMAEVADIRETYMPELKPKPTVTRSNGVALRPGESLGIDATDSSLEVILEPPSTKNAGRFAAIYRVDTSSNLVTVRVGGGPLINGVASSFTITTPGLSLFFSDGTSYWTRAPITYVEEVPLVHNGNTSSRWSLDNSNSNYLQIDVTDQGLLCFSVPLPRVGVLSEIRAVICGGTGASHAALPANKPSIELFEVTYTVGVNGFTDTSIGSATDAPANVAAYELVHELSITGLSKVLTSTTPTYHLRIKGESGANAVANVLRVGRIYCVVTCQ